jgi:hypothetical protein
VHVIVKLKDNPKLQLLTSKTDSAQKIEKNKVKHAFSSFNGFSAELSLQDIEKLNSDPQIESVEYDYHIKPTLQDSINLMNSTIIWPFKINNLNLTGLGEAVCIIDTGVNYSHSDLGGCFGNNNASSSCKVIGGYDFGDDDSDPMDYSGHGTHVAGIVSANGSISGMAPDAKIIAIKVFSNDGSSSGSDIISGIEWCVGNSSIFNITAITISLGLCSGDPCTDILRNSYCDSEFSSYATSINNAIAKNISVTISTGNDYNFTHIGVPACLENATAVASVSKSDIVASYSNRNNLTKILAIGSLVNSTRWSSSSCLSGCACSGNYMVCSGTSMAAPMVAGAIAIFKQTLKRMSQSKTPKQIENILNNTGKVIYDSSSGLNFSRLDLFQAIINLDSNSPNTTLNTPANNSISSSNNQTFSCNITDDLQIKNTTLYIWNSSSIYYYNSTSKSDTSSQASFNITTLPYGNYKWNFYSCDFNNNCSYSASNFSIILSGVSSDLSAPENSTSTNQDYITFVCNTTSNAENSLNNITLFLWNSSSIIVYNQTKNISGAGNQTDFNISISNFSDGNYYWNCFAVNNASRSSYSGSNFTIILDFTPPAISLFRPLNNTWYNSLSFNLTTDEDSDSCIFSLNHGDNQTMNKTNSTRFYYLNSSMQTNNSHNNNITFYCNDSLGNLNASYLVYFGIDTIYPNITIIYPEEGYSETASSSTLNFTFNASDNLNISSCSLVINNAISLTNTSMANQHQTYQFSQTISSGSYLWKINCTDEADNEAASISRSLVINTPIIINSGSSGGGGGIQDQEQIYTPTMQQTRQSYTTSLSKNNKIKFSISKENHTLTITKIEKDYVNITIQSSPRTFLLSIGEEKKINLTNPEYLDFYIKLNSILNNKANLTIKEINEPISQLKEQNQSRNNSDKNTAKSSSEENVLKNSTTKQITIVLLILLLIIILIFIIRKIHFWMYLKKHNKKNDETNKKTEAKE